LEPKSETENYPNPNRTEPELEFIGSIPISTGISVGDIDDGVLAGRLLS